MEKIELNDFTKYKYISNLRYSPDGKNAAFIANKCCIEDNNYNSNIYVYNIKTNCVKEIVNYNGIKDFIWIDNVNILFSVDNESQLNINKTNIETTIYYRININQCKKEKEFAANLNFEIIEKISDGIYVVIVKYDSKKTKLSAQQDGEQGYEMIDEVPFWRNGIGYTSKKRNSIYIFNSYKNSFESVSNKYFEVRGVAINNKKDQIVYFGRKYTDIEHCYSEIYLYDIEEDIEYKVVEDGKYNIKNIDFIENEIIFTASEMLKYGLHENPHFYCVSKENKIVKRINKYNYSIGNTVVSDCRFGNGISFKTEGQYIYFLSTVRYNTFLCRMGKDGEIKMLTKANGTVDEFDIHLGRILFIGMKNYNLQELYSLEQKDKNEKKITNFNVEINQKKKLSIPEKLIFNNENNKEIDGWVMKPADFNKDQNYPAILNIHGGPKVAYGEIFVHEMQYWANRGYFVFFCNPTGSDGRGNEFSDLRNKYGKTDYLDIMHFTDEVIKSYPQIDINRLGVTGGSYGGFMTSWIIGHNDRFKAAVSQRGISNWISDFGMSDISYFWTPNDLEATPWSNLDKLWWHSPLKYADKVKTPTLFIHSEKDYHCCLTDALQMFTALKYHGVESKICMFKGENHDLSRTGKPLNRVKRLEKITKWFDKYLKN